MKSKKTLAALVALVVGIALFVVPIAAAHHPEIVVELDCNGKVTYTVTAWTGSSNSERTFTGVKVYWGSTLVGTGNFDVADSFSFSGSFNVDSSVTSVTLTADTNGTWGDGYTGHDTRSDTGTRPGNCVASPSISTQSSGPVTIGGKIHDVATLSGAVGATGAVTFQIFGPGDTTCATPLTTLATSSKNVDADGNGTYTSADYTTSATGAYRWRAFFAGDGKNNPASGTCGAQNESSTVDKTSPSISTTLSSGSVLTGSSVHDSAGLSGVTAGAGGTVHYTVYSNANCNAGTQDAGTKTVSNGSVPDSNSITFNAPGTYYWEADYSGDAENGAATSPCTAEALTVNAPPQHPAIAITKSPKSQTVKAGTTATFSITVTNIGDVTLTNVTVTDPLSPECAKTSASIPALSSMAPGASVTYNCSQSNVLEAFTNVATATGTPPSGSNVTASDSAPVTVTSNPSITIVKDPKSQSVTLGGTATFEITVTNTGDVTLTAVTVSDPLSPNCNRDLGTLTAGQSKSYSCSRGNVRSDLRNVATATGKPPTGPGVSATDHADVHIAFTPPSKPKPQHPRIAIVKSPKHQTVTTRVEQMRTTAGATRTAIAYGTARFTITVKNTGDVKLHGVVVNDPRSQNCNRRLGTLAPGASRSYRCVRAAVSGGYTNVAVVTGTSPKGKKVLDSDHAAVTVVVKTTTSSGTGTAGAKHETSKPKPTPKPATATTPPSSIGTASGSPNFTG